MIMNFLGSLIYGGGGGGGDGEGQQQHQQPPVTHGGAYPAGGGFPYPGDEDLLGAAQHAADLSELSPSFFADILHQLGERREQVVTQDIDEEEAIRHHTQYFSSSSLANPEAATPRGLGNAAALQALKLFNMAAATPYDTVIKQLPQSQNAFVGLAMAQAAKLYDEQLAEGNVSTSLEKEMAVMKAGEMALGLYTKSQGTVGGGALLGGGNKEV